MNTTEPESLQTDGVWVRSEYTPATGVVARSQWPWEAMRQSAASMAVNMEAEESIAFGAITR
jgi:hypothetical protein